jgi:hypothetical protein
MKEKPIIFSETTIPALLNTKAGIWPVEPIDPSQPFKLITRQIVKPQPDTCRQLIVEHGKLKEIWRGDCWVWNEKTIGKPKYDIGDILWVRETFRKISIGFDMFEYRADSLSQSLIPWKPSIFMPREASRISLEVKDVKIERVQDITEEDALAEGVFPGKCTGCGACSGSDCYNPIGYFEDLWDTLNAKRGYSWENNPWVFAYEFMRVK